MKNCPDQTGPGGVILTADWYKKVQPTMGCAISRQVVLGCIANVSQAGS